MPGQDDRPVARTIGHSTRTTDVLIELLQAQTGYRYAEWGDVLANSNGCVAGSLLYFTPLRRLMRYIDGKLASLLRR